MSIASNIKALMFNKPADYTGPTLANAKTSGTLPASHKQFPQDDFAAAAETFYDHDVLELVKGIREGSISAQLSDVTLKSLDDIALPLQVKTIGSMPAAPQVAAGRNMKLSDLSVLKLLGIGGSGKVYLTKDTISTECFALKVIKKSGRAPKSLENILREQRVLRKVSGEDSFFPLEASWHDTENFYLATPYFPGGDLACELIRCYKFEAGRAKLYTAELVHALAFLHQAKIIHRDVKPSNILFRADGHIVLADFGLSKIFDETADYALTSKPSWISLNSEVSASHSALGEFMTNEVTGTAYFMAPEMHFGEPYSFNVDFWAVGVTLYRMLTGRMPFGATAANKAEIANMSAKDALLFTAEDDVDPITQDLLQGFLAKNHGNRLTMEEIKKHGYFLGVDWAQPSSCEVEAKWKPFLKHIPKTARTDIPIVPGQAYTSIDDPYPGYTFNSAHIQFGAQKDSTRKGAESKDTSRPVQTVFDRVYTFFRSVFGGDNTPSRALPRPTISSPMPFVSQSANLAVTADVSHTATSEFAPQQNPVRSTLLTSPRPSEGVFARITERMWRFCSSDVKTRAGLKPLLLRADAL